MTEFISDLKNVATIKEAFAKLEAAEKKVSTDATELWIKLQQLGINRAKVFAGDAGVDASTLPELFKAIGKEVGWSNATINKVINQAREPDSPSLGGMGSSSDAASGARKKNKSTRNKNRTN